MTRRLLALSWLAGLVPAAALAAPERLCPGYIENAEADARMLGHIPYAEASARDLVAMPASFALGKPCLLHRDAARDLGRLLGAARAAHVTALRGVSCFRGVERQRTVFCGEIGPGKACRTPAERARHVGPPGYSEHATGYALDFAVRPSPGCPDVTACIAQTRAGRWLLDNAPEYGFELSFPAGNAQSVTWEPWHWRWVGAGADAPGAAVARGIFARARREFAAFPAVEDFTPLPPLPPTIAPSPRLDYAPLPDAPLLLPAERKGTRRKG